MSSMPFLPLNPGFDIEEAKTLIAMIAEMEGPTPPLDDPPLPVDWTLIYDSNPFGPFDNRWQCYKNNKNPTRFALLIRGTVNQAGSIIADLLAVMIQANGAIRFKLGDESLDLDYHFADPANGKAGVHLGFALAALIMMYDPSCGILPQLKRMVDKGTIPPGSGIYIAGHSQGAAVATLCHSLLHYKESNHIDLPGFTYKTYLFAQPKPGNDCYGNDFNRIATDIGMAFLVNNDQDWVPQVPLTLQSLDDLIKPNPLSVIENILFSWFIKLIHWLMLQVRKLIHVPVQHSKAQKLITYFQNEQFRDMVFKGQSLDLRGRDLSEAKLALPKIMLTLNYTNCGIPYTLKGQPGTNPQKSTDVFWQHHAAMYYYLLAGIPIPKK